MARRGGFTLIEIVMAVTILGIMMVVVSISFTSVANNWKRSTTVAERMQTADYALNQIVAGLRSAYYPVDGNQKDEWGFALYDNGEGEDVSSSDIIEWTKLGNSIVGDKSVLGETTHRVRLWVEAARSKDEPGGLWTRVWNPDLLVQEDNNRFDDEDYGKEFLLVEDVIGFDCVVQKDEKEVEEDGRPKWAEEWSTSNQIPYRVKITFRMKPPEDTRDEPLPILRVVEIPVWQLSQNPFSLDSAGGKGSKKTDSKTGGNTTGGNKTGGGGNNTGGGRNGAGTRGGSSPMGPGGMRGGPGGGPGGALGGPGGMGGGMRGM